MVPSVPMMPTRRVRVASAAICAPGNQNFMAQAEKTRKPVIAECDAGLVKIAVPIFNKDEFLGTAGGCGLNCCIEREHIGLFCEAVNQLNDIPYFLRGLTQTLDAL